MYKRTRWACQSLTMRERCWNEGPGVFRMHANTSGGGKIRLVIEAPVFGADATAKGLF